MTEEQVNAILALIPAGIDGKHVVVQTFSRHIDGYVWQGEPILGILRVGNGDESTFIDVATIASIKCSTGADLDDEIPF